MKTMLLIFAALMVFVAGGAQANQQVTLGQDHTLVIQEVTEVMRVPNVPVGLTAERASDLVTGKATDVTIKGETLKTMTFHPSFPWFMWKAEYHDRTVSYRDSAWTVQTSSRIMEGYRIGNTISVFWFPVLLILVMSLVNSLERKNMRELFLFYATVLLSATVGMRMGMANDSLAAGTFGGMLTGAFLCTVVGARTNGPPGVIVGVFVGMLVGSTGGILSRSSNDAALVYIALLLGAEAVVFLFALLIASLKKKMHVADAKI